MKGFLRSEPGDSGDSKGGSGSYVWSEGGFSPCGMVLPMDFCKFLGESRKGQVGNEKVLVLREGLEQTLAFKSKYFFERRIYFFERRIKFPGKTRGILKRWKNIFTMFFQRFQN